MPVAFYVSLGVLIVALLLPLSLIVMRLGNPPGASVQPPSDVEVRLAALELTVAGLPSLWESERSRAEAAANSARTARARAERLTRQREEELDADDDVRGDDAREGRAQRMPAVHAEVGVPAQPNDYAAMIRREALLTLKAI